jgi:hypothetical protein
LLILINEKNCTAFIGAGASASWLPLAQKQAERIGIK